MSSILIIDDEPGIWTVLSDILEDEQYDVHTAADGYQGLAILRDRPVDLVILDVLLPNMGGIDVLKEIKKEYPDIEVVVISGHASIDIAVKSVKLGAFDFAEKPLSMEKTINLVRNALRFEDLRKENENLKNSLFLDDEMIGVSAAMQQIWARIDQSAGSDAKILIYGENGTGKELVAREIHRRSTRVDKPFVEVNCAAIPDSLIESELFGHEKGAFTSAVNMRKGKFELADGGTLFLDEIADMSLSAQAKVLRAIQELQFERVGGEKSISVDVRLIAATNKDMPGEIAAKKFREDLYFRLNVVPIEVPPLRERIEDLDPLIEYFMAKFDAKHDSAPKKISPMGVEKLKQYQWPGNIRELKNFVERINIMAEGREISAETVALYLGENNSRRSESSGLLGKFQEMKLHDARNEFEKSLIEARLRDHAFNIARTAESLGIYPSNLHGKIRKLGINAKK